MRQTRTSELEVKINEETNICLTGGNDCLKTSSLSEFADKVYYLPHEGVVVVTLDLARVHLLPFVGTEARPFWEQLSVAEHAAVNGAGKCRLEHLETCARNTQY